MSRGVRGNTLVKASEQHPQERPGMLGVNERHLTVRHHSGEAARRRCSGLGVANRDRNACRNGYFGRGSFDIVLAGSVASSIRFLTKESMTGGHFATNLETSPKALESHSG
jgi:hypothetical protein